MAPVSGPVFLVEKMDSAWVAAHLTQMKGKILLLPAQDTTDAPRFHADAERFSDSALAALGRYVYVDQERSGRHHPLLHEDET